MVETVEKLPPHNMEAEQSVLGSLLIDRDAVIRIASFLKPIRLLQFREWPHL